MTYSFASLSPAEFEDLARDLLGAEFGKRFEAFGPGPDGGMDGRHAKSGRTIVLQAKHYRLSGFAALARQLREERVAIDRLKHDRYILATSVSLTPANKKALSDIIGPTLLSSDDLLGFEDLNGLLRTFDAVAKSHVKLWLSDTAVLERVLNSASYNFTTMTRADIAAKLRVYAENPSFADARMILADHRILIVSGPPGVGKTTLAEMLAYAHIAEDWDLIAIRSLDDGFARIDDRRRQIFFFDDFLGRIALDERALSTQESQLGRFIARVQRTPTARFVLTTRAYIYEEAKLHSDVLSDRRLNVSRFVLDVGSYTRRIRARILYNHLIVAGVSTEHLRALAETQTIKKIVDHQHYNPRIIEAMTDTARIGDVPAADYPSAFIEALDNPELIWDKAFRNHISRRCQHLLFALFFSAEYGAEIVDVEEVFDGFHPLLAAKFGLSWGTKDFEDSLKTLEGSFILIAYGRISFINPSVRDYLNRFLKDKSLLTTMAGGAPTASCAMRLVDMFKQLPHLQRADWQELVSRFSTLCGRLNTIPRWRRMSDRRIRPNPYEMTNSSRLHMLVVWWRLSGEDFPLQTAIEIATHPIDGFSQYEDVRSLLDLLADLLKASRSERVHTAELISALETAIRKLLGSNLNPDNLETAIGVIDAHRKVLGERFAEDISVAIPEMIENIGDNLGNVESVSTLADYLTTVDTLSSGVGYDIFMVALAKELIERRISEVKEAATEDEEISVTGSSAPKPEKFDDKELSALFAPLLAGENESA